MGPFGIEVGGAYVDVPEASQRLIAFLALTSGRCERLRVAASLWPDKDESRATANLRSALWRLPTTAGPLVSTHGSLLELSDRVVVDTDRFEQAGWSLINDRGGGDLALDRTLLFRCLLPSWYDDWVLLERERLAQLQLHFLEALTYALLRRGAVAEALDTAIRLVSSDPLREGSQRALLTVYCIEGSLGQAQRQLDRYRFQLEDAFGCAPALSIGRILHAIERGDALTPIGDKAS
jgi:DNA-binding SARP family transcriptional activator